MELSKKKPKGKHAQKPTATKSSPPAVADTTPKPWYEGEPIGAQGRETGKKPVSILLPDIPIMVRRQPGMLRPITAPSKQQPDTARFSFPGSENRMAEVSGDPRLSDPTVATVAANTIQRAFLEAAARRAEKTAKAAKPGEVGFVQLTSAAEKKRQRASEFSQAANRSFAKSVIARRDEVADRAALSSLHLMSGAEKFAKVAKKSQSGGDFRQEFADNFERVKTVSKYTSEQQEFIRRMEAMAPEMRGSMYFGAEAQEKIQSSGGLFAKHTRQQLGMGNESKTTASDERMLGNQDHVFFYLEHENTPMRNSRFAAKSTEDGSAAARSKEEDESVASGSRRISFPLSSLMQKGTWAMKQDFLSPEAIGKELPVHENFVATRKSDPDLASRDFMRQMAISALDMPGLKNKKTPLVELLKLNNQQLSETVFHQHLRPQLMVPSVVNLNSRGAILDMPAKDAVKKS